MWFINVRRSKKRNAYVIELFAKRKKGLHIQSVQKLLQGIMVYITNIPTEWVPKGEILDLYSLRWQIGVSR
ncbi:hypothetical protein DN407_31180 (plasmid) [Bacillus sp. JAS24-2]|nr:hypothetical protein DN407_31180 [Bacillus sp. JAS24-2]